MMRKISLLLALTIFLTTMISCHETKNDSVSSSKQTEQTAVYIHTRPGRGGAPGMRLMFH